MIVCAGRMESFEFALSIGVGMVDAAASLTSICIQKRPSYLLFVGTAGSYGRLKPLDIVVAKSSTNIEQCLLKEHCYTPIKNKIEIQNALYDSLSILKKQHEEPISPKHSDVSHETFATVNSSNYICTDKNISKKYLLHDIEAENMEFFSVVSVAKRFNIEVGGVFVITNYCDKNAHFDFEKNHNDAMRKLQKYINDKGVVA